jgi:hypothetical protein
MRRSEAVKALCHALAVAHRSKLEGRTTRRRCSRRRPPISPPPPTAPPRYYLQIPAEYANTLPTQVIQPVKSGTFIHCTTDEVFSLNARAQENVRDLIFLSGYR